MSSEKTVPGVVLPTIKPYPEGAHSARTAGIAITNANASQQTSLIKTAHGGYRKRIRGGGTTQITVPTLQVLYPEPGAGTQTVNGNITGATKLGATSSANSVYDSCVGQGPSCTAQVAASQNGGILRAKNRTRNNKRPKMGGIKWGCYSGGKQRQSKKRARKNKTKKNKRRKYY